MIGKLVELVNLSIKWAIFYGNALLVQKFFLIEITPPPLFEPRDTITTLLSSFSQFAL